MTYAVLQDLVDRFGRDELIKLTDRAEPATGDIDPDIVEEAMNDADAEINSYLSRQYTTPLSPVPDQVKRLACVIARFRLHKDYANEAVRKAYDDAIAWLKLAADGKVQLGNAGETVTDAPTTNVAEFTTGKHHFSRDKMKGF